MEQSLSRRLEAMDRRLNGLLRKAALVAVTLAAMALALMLLPYCWPFVLAFAFSRMLEPFVRMAAKGRIRLGRKAAAALGVLLLFGVAGALAAALVTRLTRELVRALPQAAAWVGEVGVPWLRGLYGQVRAALPDLLPDLLDNALASLAQSAVGWAASLSAALTSGAFSTAASIPHALLGTVLLVMGTYYMTADRARIAAFFHRTFPGGLMKRGKLVSARLWQAVLLQVRSQLMVSLAVTLFLMIALGVFRVRYGLLIGLGIGVADALPVLGAGLFLIPWSIAAFVAGDAGLGVLAACLYVGTVVIRQVLEPRIVGHNLGLYPLATMAAMYAGYRLLGFLGLLAGPVLLNVIVVVLEADERASPADPRG